LIQVIEYIDVNRRNEFNILNAEHIKISENENIEMDIAEFVFKSENREPIRAWSRVALNGKLNWYVAQTNVILFDKENGIYLHTVHLVELVHKLSTVMCSNLSFNNFLIGAKQYANLLDVVKRLNLLTPFETVDRLLDTRIITSEFEAGGGNVDILPLMTDTLKEKLTDYTDVPEFVFEGRTYFEALSEIFSLIGGSPKLINTQGDNKVLDITFFDKANVISVDMSNYDEYECNKDIRNYSANAQVTTNNIVDNQSYYVAGVDWFKHIESLDKVLDEAQATFKTDLPIYKLLKATVKYKPTNEEKDATEYIISSQEWNILPVNTPIDGSPSTMNTLKYTIGAEDVTNFAQKIQKQDSIFNSLVWQEFIKDIGFTTPITDLFDYVMQIEFIPLQKGNRFNVKPISFIENNVDSTININVANRINESSKVIKNAINKATQANSMQIIKRFRHNSIDDAFDLGVIDADTKFKIVKRDIEENNGVVIAEYTLTRDKNIISDIVGVNTINRPTDVEVGKGLVRNEIYEDYCIFSPYKPSVRGYNETNDTSVKGDFAEKKFLNLFLNNHDGFNRAQGFLINSTDILNPPIVNSSVITGLRTLNFDLNFLNQAYVGNKIVPDTTGFFESKDVEQGVRYTLGNSTVRDMSLRYGLRQKKDKDTITFDEIKLLPEAQDLVYDDDTDLDYLQPLIEVGTSIETQTELNEVVDTTGFSRSYDVIKWFTGSTAEISKTYTITDSLKERMRQLNFDVLVDIDRLNQYSNKTELTVIYVDTNGYERQAILKTYFAENQSFTGTNYIYPQFENGSVTESVDINDNVQSLEIKLKVYFVIGIVLRHKADFLINNVNYDYIKFTSDVGNGLYLDKNQNEILGLNYQMHYTTLPQYDINDFAKESIIVGSAVTRNSPMLINNARNYTSFKIYASNQKYGLYDDFVRGAETTATFTATKTGDVYEILATGLPIGSDSWAIVGVRADATEDFLIGVNRGSGAFNKFYAYFRHNHPLLIKNN